MEILRKQLKREFGKRTRIQVRKLLEPEAFFPVAKDATLVRAAQLAVLELLKQPDGTRDVTWLIKIFNGIQQQFKKSLSQRMSSVPVRLVDKEE